MAATIKDIAKKCGVSEGTVDRALNNRGGIKEETKELILSVAKEMNYQPNHLARCLAKGKTHTIGVISINLSNTFFSMLIEAVEAKARENGYFIELILTHNDKERELEAIKYFTTRKVDGLIIFPVGKGDEYGQILKKVNVPIVSVYNRICKDIVHIDIDCRKIMREAVSFIASKGYKKIWYLDWGIEKLIAQDINTFSLNQRRRGYEEGLIIEDMGEPKVMTRYNEEKLLEIVNRDCKAAVLCPCDNIAIKVLDFYKRKGIKVPEQVGIIGFDNIEMLDRISPRLYSVDCKIRTIGKNAFDMLLAQINNENEIHDCVVEHSFTKGETL